MFLSLFAIYTALQNPYARPTSFGHFPWCASIPSLPDQYHKFLSAFEHCRVSDFLQANPVFISAESSSTCSGKLLAKYFRGPEDHVYPFGAVVLDAVN